MTIPDYLLVMLPLLRLAKDINVHNIQDATETLADFY